MSGDDEPFSGSGDEVNVTGGQNKRTPSSSGPTTTRKRGRKACGDAIVEAMLEIAAASKMRAAALTKDVDRFSISKCIKALDDLQGFSLRSDESRLNGGVEIRVPSVVVHQICIRRRFFTVIQTLRRIHPLMKEL